VAACANGGAASPSASGGSSAGTAGVRLGNPSEHVAATDQLVFVPATQTLHVGDIVQWTNTGTVPHTVTFDSQPNLTDPSDLAPGETWEVKLNHAGTFPYRCTIHPGMTGTLIVK
jgi:plastocyanin